MMKGGLMPQRSKLKQCWAMALGGCLVSWHLAHYLSICAYLHVVQYTKVVEIQNPIESYAELAAPQIRNNWSLVQRPHIRTKSGVVGWRNRNRIKESTPHRAVQRLQFKHTNDVTAYEIALACSLGPPC